MKESTNATITKYLSDKGIIHFILFGLISTFFSQLFLFLTNVAIGFALIGRQPSCTDVTCFSFLFLTEINISAEDH